MDLLALLGPLGSGILLGVLGDRLALRREWAEIASRVPAMRRTLSCRH